MRSSETVVQSQCAKCHQTGQDGAPKIGDRPAWISRLKKGLDNLVASAKGQYHVTISLADKSQVPVTDAEVQVLVSDGMTTERKSLGLVTANNAVSYGNYFRFDSGNSYNITAAIRRPGVDGTIEAKFEFKAP